MPGITALILGLTLLQSAHIGRLALDRYPGDVRNPYFYQQTPRPFLRLIDHVRQASDARSAPLNIAVVSSEAAWPLPWYLRQQPHVGYFTTSPPPSTPWDMVVWDSQVGSFSSVPYSGDWMRDYVGLRPGVVLEIATRREVWDLTHPPSP